MELTLEQIKTGGYLVSLIAIIVLFSYLYFENNSYDFFSKKNTLIQSNQQTPIMIESFGNDYGNSNHMNNSAYSQSEPSSGLFYGNTNYMGTAASNNPYRGPNPAVPTGQQNVNLNTSGDQLLSFQLYQQAINAATPTAQQLDSIAGQSQQQTGMQARGNLGGGLASNTAPYDLLNNKEYQAVNMSNERAQRISACAQNAPTFVATSLLPKPSIPGQESWNINAPQNILANQNFLSATQQIGIDTVLGSLRNPSYDIRNNIPNPINIVSPWLNTTILPDLERRPLDCFIPQNGLYGCAESGGCNTNGSFVGR